MSKRDIEDAQARAALATGNVDPKALDKLKPGAVFEVEDKLIHLPEEPDRAPHPLRRVIIFQNFRFLGGGRPNTVLVVPCSASQKTSQVDYNIPSDEPAFTKDGIVAFTTLLMPVLKSEFRAQHYKGDLRPQTLGELQANVLNVLGLSPGRLPPR